MMSTASLLGLVVPLLAGGTVGAASVTNETNTCLDPEDGNYRCSLLPGVLSLNLTRCGIIDEDVDDLTACIDAVDHDPIQEIWLGDNGITTLPEDIFAGTANLRHLYLDGNSLITLSSGLFNGLSKLEWLHLDFNSLASLPAGIFAGMGSLEELDLEGNVLESLDEDIFSDLGALRTLWLGNNALEGLSEGTFDGLQGALQQLHLHTNNLSTLPSDVFVNLDALTFLDLSENPDLECLPLPGPNVGASYLILPDNFAEGGTCACPVPGAAGACNFDCEAGSQGYICSAGPTPSPASSVDAGPAATTVTAAPAATTATAAPAAVTATAAPSAISFGITIAPDASLPTSAPTTATRDIDTPAPTSDSTCKNGIPGYQIGDACCKPGCMQCGGPDCSTSSLSKGLDNNDCCVDTIIANGVECGGDVVAPCINYHTLAPSFAPIPVVEACITETQACEEDAECRQCISMTSVDQTAEWTACTNSSSFNETDACAFGVGLYCCVAEVSTNEACLADDLFVAYAECFLEEATEGAECPLDCPDVFVASTVEGSGAGRSSSSNLVTSAYFLAGLVTLAMLVGWA